MSYTMPYMTSKSAKDSRSLADSAADRGKDEDSRIKQVNGPGVGDGKPLVLGARRAELDAEV